MLSGPAVPVPPSPRGVGYRFRRPLTTAELESITAAAKGPGKDGGLDGAFEATWDILLGEAEGLTVGEAVARGLRFHPVEYAIPESQCVTLLRIWRRYRGPRYRSAAGVGLLWMTMGPGSYPDEERACRRCPRSG